VTHVWAGHLLQDPPTVCLGGPLLRRLLLRLLLLLHLLGRRNLNTHHVCWHPLPTPIAFPLNPHSARCPAVQKPSWECLSRDPTNPSKLVEYKVLLSDGSRDACHGRKALSRAVCECASAQCAAVSVSLPQPLVTPTEWRHTAFTTSTKKDAKRGSLYRPTTMSLAGAARCRAMVGARVDMVATKSLRVFLYTPTPHPHPPPCFQQAR
jgi:hypothetical protein